MQAVIRAAALAVVLLAGAPSAAEAQSDTVRVLAVMDMMRADIVAREAGAPADQGNIYFSGTVSSLYPDETRSDHLVRNFGDGIVTVAGFCDSACGDLDFYVLDENDNVIASDTGPDAHPVVTFRPVQSGSYRMRAEMFACQDKCFYAAAVYYRLD